MLEVEGAVMPGLSGGLDRTGLIQRSTLIGPIQGDVKSESGSGWGPVVAYPQRGIGPSTTVVVVTA